jgi:hypothetical protein
VYHNHPTSQNNKPRVCTQKLSGKLVLPHAKRHCGKWVSAVALLTNFACTQPPGQPRPQFRENPITPPLIFSLAAKISAVNSPDLPIEDTITANVLTVGQGSAARGIGETPQRTWT